MGPGLGENSNDGLPTCRYQALIHGIEKKKSKEERKEEAI